MTLHDRWVRNAWLEDALLRAKANFPKGEIPGAHELAARAAKRAGLFEGWRDGTLSRKQRRRVLRALRMLGRQIIRRWAETLIEALNPDYQAPSKGLIDAARAKIGGFFGKVKRVVRELFVAGALALNGPDFSVESNRPVNDAVATLVAEQEGYLKVFEQEVLDERKPLNGTFVSRAEQYGASVFQAAIETDRQAKITAGQHKEERRVLGRAEHCGDCPPIADLGWRPIGTLPRIGFKNAIEPSECRNFCECHFVYR